MAGINLHQVVRGIIPAIHPDEQILLVQNAGAENIRGVVVPKFHLAGSFPAQIQSFKADDLQAMVESARTEVQRKIYLFAETGTGLIPQGIVRSLERGGDLIRRRDGTWWLVAGMVEDFSAAGWVSVRGVLQIEVHEEAEKLAALPEEPMIEPYEDDGYAD